MNLWSKLVRYKLAGKKESFDKAIISLFLPEGMLDYFEVSSVEKTEESYTISLVEKSQHPEKYWIRQ